MLQLNKVICSGSPFAVLLTLGFAISGTPASAEPTVTPIYLGGYGNTNQLQLVFQRGYGGTAGLSQTAVTGGNNYSRWLPSGGAYQGLDLPSVVVPINIQTPPPIINRVNSTAISSPVIDNSISNIVLPTGNSSATAISH